MNPIDQAILQDEIRQALNALFKSGQVGRAETKTVLSAPLDNGMLQREPGIELEEGEKYNVSLDSGDYEAVCKSHSFDGENTFYYLGDMAMYYPDVFESTGESFLVAADEAFIMAMDTNRGGYIRVRSETIHPIDQKFLPPVDIITMNGADGKQYKLTVSGGALNIAEVV